ncbi:metallophosphoesterase [Methanomethylophilus alvi]|uniref:metallophosphoesterase n=1 Tax=Methanomethylophilus alvi TaxID=1291540 RepID=UPI0037DCB5E3
MSMNYYIADTHFGDERIIGYCDRPFATVEEMTETIINRWNSVVDANDDVYIVGDFACGDISNLKEIIDSLNGRKYLIPGNHDECWMNDGNYRSLINMMNVIDHVVDGENEVILCHYPLCAFDGSLSGAFHVYGHVHNNINEPNYAILGKLKNSYNAGVDVNDFFPRSLEQLVRAKQ